jgi:hypothetical protein
MKRDGERIERGASETCAVYIIASLAPERGTWRSDMRAGLKSRITVFGVSLLQKNLGKVQASLLWSATKVLLLDV